MVIPENTNLWGVEIFLVTSCFRNRDMLRPGEPLGSYADLTLQIAMNSSKIRIIFFLGKAEDYLISCWCSLNTLVNISKFNMSTKGFNFKNHKKAYRLI